MVEETEKDNLDRNPGQDFSGDKPTVPNIVYQDRRKTDGSLDNIIKSVDTLSSQVTVLNEKVYTKAFLNRTRDKIITISVLTVLILSVILIGFVTAIHREGVAEEARSKDRAAEATEFRHQLADCQLAPGTILKDKFVNPGVCYTEIENRTGEILSAAIERINNKNGTSQDCLYLRGIGVRPAPCIEVNAMVDSFKNGVDPFPTPTPLPGKQTTTTVKATTTTSQKASTPTSTTRMASVSTTSTTSLSSLLCSALALVGLC